MTQRLLIALAHPDDESFGLGGLIARYVDEGAEVYLICATNGDSGTVAPDMLDGYSSVAELRLAELDCATAKLGIKEVFKFGYKDSGMMGSQANDDPQCLWQAPRDEVARRVVEVMRTVRPQVVITFNEYGGYGHPDHIAIQRATVDAFSLASDPHYTGSALPPYQPQKLYYTSFPTRALRFYIAMLRLRGKDPRRLGVNGDVDLQAVLDHALPVHAQVDVRPYLRAWDEASACHASQQRGGPPRMPLFLRQLLMGKQGFTRVHPAPGHARIDEHDLFAGVKLD